MRPRASPRAGVCVAGLAEKDKRKDGGKAVKRHLKMKKAAKRKTIQTKQNSKED